MTFWGKQYTAYKHENFDGFLRHVGVPEDKIQALVAAPSVQKFEKNGDSYVHSTLTPEGPKETPFKCGEEVNDNIGPSKVPIKSTFKVDGNIITQTIKADKGNAVFKREFNGDELLVTITTEGWDGVAKRYYKA